MFTLRFRVVELTTLNIALLGRQPKCSSIMEFRVLLFIFNVFWFLAVSMISVSAGWFNFRIRKGRCKSYRMLNVQREV